MPARCSHLTGIKVSTTRTRVCEECVRVGDTWLHLRLCLECGHVGCCDSSKNRHATRLTLGDDDLAALDRASAPS